MGEFTIWCDGSYRQKHNLLGIAWLSRALPDRELLERALTLPKIEDAHNHGSDIAEYWAFAYAVGRLPAGSKVRVHMDAQNVMDCLAKGSLGKKVPRELSQAFDEALAAKERMAQIEFVKASDKNNENMGRAHALSQLMSTPPKEEKRKKPNAHQDSQRPSSPRGS